MDIWQYDIYSYTLFICYSIGYRSHQQTVEPVVWMYGNTLFILIHYSYVILFGYCSHQQTAEPVVLTNHT
jgi:hypothetical protein